MTVERALNVLNAVSLGRGSGHAYTYEEAERLLRFGVVLAGLLVAHPAAEAPQEPNAEIAPASPLRLISVAQAA